MPIPSENSELDQLRHAARDIFYSALRAVNAQEAIQRVVAFDGSTLKISSRQFDTVSREIYVLAIGKAAPAMAAGLIEILGERIRHGVLTGPPLQNATLFSSATWQVFVGGHPLPDQQSLEAARASFELLQRADEARAIVIFLVSGGGSAMIEWPCNEQITLEDLRAVNRILISSGATIREVNAVRRAFSAIKGGRLAACARRATQINLIVSDVNPGEEADVASGPTIFTSADSPDPREVILDHRLRSTLPTSILQTVDSAPISSLSRGDQLDQLTHVILENQSALKAAAEKAERLGFRVKIASDIREQPIGVGCDLLLARLIELQSQSTAKPVCLISGGEFRCPVKGNGKGGRNLETALRCAIALDEEAPDKPVAVLSAGTDGIDGNSPAAGAVADQTTIARGRAASLPARAFLENSDSFTFFESVGDTIITGPTGTNVRDVRILLMGNKAFSGSH